MQTDRNLEELNPAFQKLCFQALSFSQVLFSCADICWRNRLAKIFQ